MTDLLFLTVVGPRFIIYLFDQPYHHYGTQFASKSIKCAAAAVKHHNIVDWSVHKYWHGIKCHCLCLVCQHAVF